MRKVFILLLLITAIFTLVGCGNKEAETLDVFMANQTSTWNSSSYHVIVNAEIDDLEALEEIAYNVASQSYEQDFDLIGTNRYTLSFYFYTTQASFDNEDSDYGMIVFMVNDSLDNPGLSLKTNELIFE